MYSNSAETKVEEDFFIHSYRKTPKIFIAILFDLQEIKFKWMAGWESIDLKIPSLRHYWFHFIRDYLVFLLSTIFVPHHTPEKWRLPSLRKWRGGGINGIMEESITKAGKEKISMRSIRTVLKTRNTMSSPAKEQSKIFIDTLLY